MGKLSNLNPKDVFGYFEDICNIPHCSGNTSAIVDYCIQFANERNLKWYRDNANNLLIWKPASPGYESAESLILQAHTDMVCEKEVNVNFDFIKDGLNLLVDGDTLHADGTTLGADNGIGVAMILAILNDNTLKHPMIEALLTSDEEIGLIGAFAFDCSKLSGHRLINLDSEYEGVLMCGCAGGVNAYSTIPVTRETASFQLLELDISGLTSGHSGVEIDKGRANSNILLGRLLNIIAEKLDFRLISMDGGSRETAIAGISKAEIGIEHNNIEVVREIVNKFYYEIKDEYASTEPNITITTKFKKYDTISALTEESTKLVCQVLISLPDGVQTISMDMENLVQTSLNFGILQLREKELYIANTIRSSMTSQKKWIMQKVKAIVLLAGGKTEANGDYPGLPYNPNSEIKDIFVRAYKELYGKEPSVEAVHAGLECGLFADGIPNLDWVSVGPNMKDVHTPKESLSISSTERTYELLVKVLEECK